MRAKDVVIGLAVVIILTIGVLMIKNRQASKLQNSPLPTPTIEQKIKDKFGGLTVPNDVERVELKDVTGGNGFGIATRTEVLADLPTPADGKAYQVWLENSDNKVLLGNMRIAKGGYLLEYNSSKFPGYNTVTVTLNGNSILEGSF